MNIFTALLDKLAPPIPQADNPERHREQALREIGALSSIPLLIAYLRHHDGYVRQAAIDRSVVLADPALFPFVAERLNDWGPQGMHSARVVLRQRH